MSLRVFILCEFVILFLSDNRINIFLSNHKLFTTMIVSYPNTSTIYMPTHTHTHTRVEMSDMMMMEWKNNVSEEQKPVSVFQGDEQCISRILSRDASIGQSSRIFSRRAQGVPFKWEKNPGTPKYPQEVEDQIPPPSPSPLMQSLGLPLPSNVNGLDRDRHGTNESALKKSIIMGLRKMSKKNIISDIISKKVEILGKWRSSDRKKESSRFGDSNGEFVGSVKGSSFSSNSSFSSDSRVLVDGPFCCNPLEVHTIADEGNTKIYYCSHHKAAFAVEEDNLFLSNILSGVSASDHEQAPTGTQPGTSKSSTENELIRPPIHPPVVPLPRPRRQDNGEEADKDSLTSKMAWFRRRKKKETRNVKSGIIFRGDEEFEASFRRSDSTMSTLSSVSSKSRRSWRRVVKIGRSLYGSYFSCSAWSRRDHFLGFC
ncbi:hypothetical protein OROHE_015793 [Orobanche hederae]